MWTPGLGPQGGPSLHRAWPEGGQTCNGACTERGHKTRTGACCLTRVSKQSSGCSVSHLPMATNLGARTWTTMILVPRQTCKLYWSLPRRPGHGKASWTRYRTRGNIGHHMHIITPGHQQRGLMVDMCPGITRGGPVRKRTACNTKEPPTWDPIVIIVNSHSIVIGTGYGPHWYRSVHPCTDCGQRYQTHCSLLKL